MWREHPATEKQKIFLNKFLERYPENITKGRASDLIGVIIEHEKKHAHSNYTRKYVITEKSKPLIRIGVLTPKQDISFDFSVTF